MQEEANIFISYDNIAFAKVVATICNTSLQWSLSNHMVMQAGNKAAVYPGDPFCEGQTEQFVLQMSFQPGGKDPPPQKKGGGGV